MYRKVIEYLHRISEGILLKYSDQTFMRILRIFIGAPNEITEEVYKELIYRRFMLKGNPLSTTEVVVDSLYLRLIKLYVHQQFNKRSQDKVKMDIELEKFRTSMKFSTK